MPNEQPATIEPGLRRMILIEIIFPMVLLILGIYHGMMQVLYRSGMIRSRQVLGLEYFQGLTLHGVVNAIVFTIQGTANINGHPVTLTANAGDEPLWEPGRFR